MPFMVRQGNQVEFIVELLDAVGQNSAPPQVKLVLTLTDQNGNLFGITTLDMSLRGFVWVVVWDSSVAPIGLTTISIVVPSLVTLAPPDPVMRICKGI